MSTNTVSLTPEDITLLIKVAENCLRFSDNTDDSIDRLCLQLNTSVEELSVVQEKAANYLNQ